MNVNLLKQVLAVPTVTRGETLMVLWLLNYFKDKPELKAWADPYGNVYVVKGQLKEGEAYPCVGAHTDSVHRPERVCIVPKPDNDDHLIALDTKLRQTGLGGDDKAGIFICLELIEKFDTIKAAFFVSEETGCHGSKACDKSFFDDVGYFVEFDSPCDNIMSYSSNHVKLFPDEGPFFDAIFPILMDRGITAWQNHPYTDVSVIKSYFAFPCLNLPAGYFKMHSSKEYVSLKAIGNSILAGEQILTALGNKEYVYDDPTVWGNAAVLVTGLETHG